MHPHTIRLLPAHRHGQADSNPWGRLLSGTRTSVAPTSSILAYILILCFLQGCHGGRSCGCGR